MRARVAQERAMRSGPRPGRLSRRRAAAAMSLAQDSSNHPFTPETRCDMWGVEKAVTENNRGLGTVWPEI